MLLWKSSADSIILAREQRAFENIFKKQTRHEDKKWLHLKSVSAVVDRRYKQKFAAYFLTHPLHVINHDFNAHPAVGSVDADRVDEV